MNPTLNQLPLRCMVIIVTDVDGNPTNYLTANALNQMVEYIGRNIIFYETHVAGLDLLVAFDHAVNDEEIIRTLALRELQEME